MINPFLALLGISFHVIVAVLRPMFSTLVSGPFNGASEVREIKKKKITKAESHPGRSTAALELLPLFQAKPTMLGLG